MMFSNAYSKTIAVTTLASILPLLAVIPQHVSAQQRMPRRTTEQQQMQVPDQSTVPTGRAVLQANPDSSEYTCQGYVDCNNAISDCIAADGEFEATEHDDEGGVIGGTCSH